MDTDEVGGGGGRGWRGKRQTFGRNHNDPIMHQPRCKRKNVMRKPGNEGGTGQSSLSFSLVGPAEGRGDILNPTIFNIFFMTLAY